MSTTYETTVAEAQERLTSMEDRQTDRNEQLQAIAYHEQRAIQLRAALDPVTKSFYHFRCAPEQHVFVYAANREQADRRLRERMTKSYGKQGEGWKIVSQAVQVYTDPKRACAAAPDNLLGYLSEAEAREFITDYDTDKAGRGDEHKLKDCPMSQLERDIANFRIRLSMKAR